MKQYFGIDIGGTAVKLGIVDETGKVLCKGEQSVNFDGYQTPVLDTVRKAAKEFLTAQAIPVENLSGIGVSATGQIDSRKGIVAGTCGNFPNYIGSPIKAALEQDFGLPVTVANDANCMTLGEVWVGGAQGYTDVIGVTLGTGVGGGILTGGRLLEGARGLGGELGHYRTHALDGVPCTCGATGCWERYAATTALVRAAKEKNPAWTDGRAIFAAAEAGNPEVLALLDAWVAAHPHFYYTKPKAGPTALVYYDFDVPSYDFCKQMYHQTGAFVTPGDCFEQPHSMRIGYACDKQTLQDGLAALAAFADTL